MFQVLLIDDEQMALQTVQWLLPWESLGVSRVLCADSTGYAKELLQKFTVDLVICDIEMPQMSGIEFAQWLQTAYPSTGVIMLTCHAEFSFAQQAMRAGSLDYILKPVKAEALAQSVRKALASLAERRAVQKEASRWESMAGMNRERLLRDLVRRAIPARETVFCNAVERLGLSESPDRPCRPVMVEVRSWKVKFSEEDVALLEYGICNMAQELVVGSEAGGTALRLEPGRILVVLYDGAEETAALQGGCSRLIGVCNRYLCCDVSCCLGNLGPLIGLAAATDRIREFTAGHAVPYNTVCMVGQPEHRAAPPDWGAAMAGWRTMLESKDYQKILDETKRLLNEHGKGQLLDVLELQQLQQDFVQMLYLYLQENNIQANQLYKDKRSHVLMERSLYSVDQLLEWMEWTLHRAGEAIESLGQEDALIRQIKDFITLHIDEDVSREMIAGAVYLTPDYLSRVFKRRTGVGLSEYIVEKRLVLAKQLLAQTDTPVGDIALQLGYSSFSHFTKIFKARMGMTPAAYRAAVREPRPAPPKKTENR